MFLTRRSMEGSWTRAATESFENLSIATWSAVSSKSSCITNNVILINDQRLFLNNEQSEPE